MSFREKIIKFVGNANKNKVLLVTKILRTNDSTLFKTKEILKIIFKSKVVKINRLEIGEQYKKLFEKCKIEIDDNDFFAYSIDFYCLLDYKERYSLGNLTVDYKLILDNSIEELKNKYNSNDDYSASMYKLLEGIEIICDRMVSKVEESSNKNKNKIIKSLKNIKDGQAEDCFDALQRILFYNQLLWQSGLPLIGIGRLDKLLDKYYKKSDRKYLENFFTILHKNFNFKSSALIGDTGQIIVLGGTENNGEYFSNEVTYDSIELLKKLQIPDPKVLLRVNNNTPDDLIELSVDCISTGIGCPLFANDDVIIPYLKKFGYDNVNNYVTSACWEPFFASESIEPNNLFTLNFVTPFNKMIDETIEFKNIEEIMKTYNVYLKEYLKEFKKTLDSVRFCDNAMLDLFIENCNNCKKSVSQGGAKYNNYGITSVGLSSVVDSIINIEKLCFMDKSIKYKELLSYRNKNYYNNYDEVLKNNGVSKYGNDDDKVLSIVNKIIEETNRDLEDYTNYLGGRVKFGLSSPAYITDSKNEKATFDGRKNGNPFNVHISSNHSTYTDLFNFASRIEYGRLGFNGNVIDFMTSPSFINKNKDKFKIFIKQSIKKGFFEFQMNVIDSKTLIEAKKNPKLYPNLIVRVWGFSTYFNELPEEYKDLLIERAMENERIGN